MQPMACLYTLIDSVEAAEDIVRTLLAERLVACANIHAPCQSIYHWQGDLAKSAEVPVLFKLPADGAARAAARLAELHPYDVPAIVSWTAQATSEFASWLDSETRL